MSGGESARRSSEAFFCLLAYFFVDRTTSRVLSPVVQVGRWADARRAFVLKLPHCHTGAHSFPQHSLASSSSSSPSLVQGGKGYGATSGVGKLQNLRVAVQRRWNNTVSDTSRQQVGPGGWAVVARWRRRNPASKRGVQVVRGGRGADQQGALQGGRSVNGSGSPPVHALLRPHPLLVVSPRPLRQAMELFLGLRIHDSPEQKGYFPGLQVGRGGNFTTPARGGQGAGVLS